MSRHLKALLVVLVLATASIWIFKSFYLPQLQEGNSSLKTLDEMENDGAPNFQIVDFQGKNFELRALHGKVVILNFWASWCAPCVEEVPSLIKLAEEFRGELQIIAISGDSSREDIEVFLKSFPGLRAENINLIWDQDRKIMNQFSISRLPESLVLDQNQKLVKKIAGTIDWHTEDSILFVKALIKK